MAREGATALLDGVVDYAGLFPPAGLGMTEAVDEYRVAMSGPRAWMLGRFVVPAARLTELASVLFAGERSSTPWRVSAIVRDASEADATSIEAFNRDTAVHGALVDAVESKPQHVDGIDWLAGRFARGMDVYVEVALDGPLDAALARIAALGLRAKVRTGGVTADAFPPPHALATFLAAAVQRRIAFKATAGLHHAVRGDYRLTYAPDAVRAPMYGYLNVLLATAALEAGHPVAVAEDILVRPDTSLLAFTADGVQWGTQRFAASALRELRARGLVSFGSCSFREPAEEFEALALR